MDEPRGRRPIDERHRCRAHTGDGQRCKKAAAKGATVCHSHGAAAPQVQAKAAERVAMDQALGELRRRGFTAVSDPLTAMAEIAGEITAVKDIFRDRLTELDEKSWRYEGDKGGEQLRAEVALYERALDRSVKVLDSLARMNIDERLAAITERQAGMIATFAEALVRRVGADPSSPEVREAIAIELEALAS